MLIEDNVVYYSLVALLHLDTFHDVTITSQLRKKI